MCTSGRRNVVEADPVGLMDDVCGDYGEVVSFIAMVGNCILIHLTWHGMAVLIHIYLSEWERLSDGTCGILHTALNFIHAKLIFVMVSLDYHFNCSLWTMGCKEIMNTRGF